MTAAAGRRALFGGSMTPDTAIVKRSLGHHLIVISVLRITRIAVLAMMAHVAFEQFWDAGNAYSVMTPHARGALLRLIWRIRIRANEQLVTLMIVEDNAASSLLVKPDDLRSELGICLLPPGRLTKQSSTQSCRDRQAERVGNNNSQLQFHLVLPVNFEAQLLSAVTVCAAGTARLPAATT
jgi:hypothetical protein